MDFENDLVELLREKVESFLQFNQITPGNIDNDPNAHPFANLKNIIDSIEYVFLLRRHILQGFSNLTSINVQFASEKRWLKSQLTFLISNVFFIELN